MNTFIQYIKISISNVPAWNIIGSIWNITLVFNRKETEKPHDMAWEQCFLATTTVLKSNEK